MSEANKIVKEYSNGDVIIVWQPHLCTHSKNCWKGLLPCYYFRRYYRYKILKLHDLSYAKTFYPTKD